MRPSVHQFCLASKFCVRFRSLPEHHSEDANPAPQGKISNQPDSHGLVLTLGVVLR